MRTCRRCNQSQNIEEFYPSARFRLGDWCKACHSLYAAERNLAKKNGTWKRTHRYVRGPFAKGTVSYKTREAERMRRSRKENPAKHREFEMNNYRKHRNAVLDFIGRICVCCGETQPFMLNIDHVNNDGVTHRAAIRGENKTLRARRYYKSIIADPDARIRFRTLCINCNFGRRANGGICPHEEQRMADFALSA